MANDQFLLEIGTEELPAIPFLKELPNLLPKWLEITKKNGFDAQFEIFYTPRRIALYSKDFNEKANDEELEFWGPPMAVAIKDGVPTKAYESFLDRNGLVKDDVKTADKDGKECLYAKKTVLGKTIGEKLNEMLNEWLKSLHFGKSMRWGSLEESFIRPIRWIVAMHAGNYISVEAYGVKSGEMSYGHRQESFDAFHILNTQDYFAKLANAGVMISGAEREAKILDDIKAIEAKHGFEVEKDSDLLAEVVAITEYPTALLGSFDKAFLKVPAEVIITSMKENQRYFPVFEGGKLSNHFVVVSNAFIDSFDKVVAGNERVLKARLSDALFFYENDLKKGLLNDGLENIVFVDGLGSVADKVAREVEIAEYLAMTLNIAEADKQNLLDAARLGKADLMTEVVYEFGELQGTMGCYYAKAMGLDAHVAEAIEEQYLPKGEDGELPKSLVGSLLSISVKLDSLIGLFSVGMVPSGSKDPYALRRAAIGIIKNLLHFSININMAKTIKELSSKYKSFDVDKLESFIVD
jgi:glycyl-tRNA synthetase beta chain